MRKVLGATLLLLVGFMAGRVQVRKVGAEPRYALANCITTFDPARASKSAHGWAFWFVRKEFSGGLNVKMSQVGPQQAHHGSHSHEEDEVFYILEGKAEFTLRDKKALVGPNSTLFCPSNVSHGIRNAGSDSLRYLVIKSK